MRCETQRSTKCALPRRRWRLSLKSGSPGTADRSRPATAPRLDDADRVWPSTECDQPTDCRSRRSAPDRAVEPSPARNHVASSNETAPPSSLPHRDRVGPPADRAAPVPTDAGRSAAAFHHRRTSTRSGQTDNRHAHVHVPNSRRRQSRCHFHPPRRSFPTCPDGRPVPDPAAAPDRRQKSHTTCFCPDDESQPANVRAARPGSHLERAGGIRNCRCHRRQRSGAAGPRVR